LAADRCALYNPPDTLVSEYPDIEVARNYDSLKDFIYRG